MSYRLPSNTPTILREAGLKVLETPGWQGRGVSLARPYVGVGCHHTATGTGSSNAAVASLLINGRPDLSGPLSNFGLQRDGTVVIIAAGRCNHGGDARPSGTVAGGNANDLYASVEAYNDGVGEPWNAVQYNAYVLLAATLSLKITKNSVETVRGHKEWSVTGKIDPTFDMNVFRDKVELKMNPPAPKPKPKTRGAKVDRAIAELKASKAKDPKRAKQIEAAIAELEKVPFLN